MDTIDRIFAIVDKKYKEQKEFAADICMAPSRISEWRNRKSQSYKKCLPEIADVLGTTIQFLLTGDDDKTNQIAIPKDSDLIIEFARIFLTLSPEKQNRIIAEMLRLQRDV